MGRFFVKGEVSRTLAGGVVQDSGLMASLPAAQVVCVALESFPMPAFAGRDLRSFASFLFVHRCGDSARLFRRRCPWCIGLNKIVVFWMHTCLICEPACWRKRLCMSGDHPEPTALNSANSDLK